MNEIQKSIIAVKQTLENVEIKATVENMERLLACHQVLEQLIENGGDNCGNTDTE